MPTPEKSKAKPEQQELNQRRRTSNKRRKWQLEESHDGGKSWSKRKNKPGGRRKSLSGAKRAITSPQKSLDSRPRNTARKALGEKRGKGKLGKRRRNASTVERPAIPKLTSLDIFAALRSSSLTKDGKQRAKKAHTSPENVSERKVMAGVDNEDGSKQSRKTLTEDEAIAVVKQLLPPEAAPEEVEEIVNSIPKSGNQVNVANFEKWWNSSVARDTISDLQKRSLRKKRSVTVAGQKNKRVIQKSRTSANTRKEASRVKKISRKRNHKGSDNDSSDSDSSDSDSLSESDVDTEEDASSSDDESVPSSSSTSSSDSDEDDETSDDDNNRVTEQLRAELEKSRMEAKKLREEMVQHKIFAGKQENVISRQKAEIMGLRVAKEAAEVARDRQKKLAEKAETTIIEKAKVKEKEIYEKAKKAVMEELLQANESTNKVRGENVSAANPKKDNSNMKKRESMGSIIQDSEPHILHEEQLHDSTPSEKKTVPLKAREVSHSEDAFSTSAPEDSDYSNDLNSGAKLGDTNSFPVKSRKTKTKDEVDEQGAKCEKDSEESDESTKGAIENLSQSGLVDVEIKEDDISHPSENVTHSAALEQGSDFDDDDLVTSDDDSGDDDDAPGMKKGKSKRRKRKMKKKQSETKMGPKKTRKKKERSKLVTSGGVLKRGKGFSLPKYHVRQFRHPRELEIALLRAEKTIDELTVKLEKTTDALHYTEEELNRVRLTHDKDADGVDTKSREHEMSEEVALVLDDIITHVTRTLRSIGSPRRDKKKPLSSSETQSYARQLDRWIDEKLKAWDEDEIFRKKRRKKYKSRDLFEASLRKKADAQLKEAASKEAVSVQK